MNSAARVMSLMSARHSDTQNRQMKLKCSQPASQRAHSYYLFVNSLVLILIYIYQLNLVCFCFAAPRAIMNILHLFFQLIHQSAELQLDNIPHSAWRSCAIFIIMRSLSRCMCVVNRLFVQALDGQCAKCNEPHFNFCSKSVLKP
jgi:hypothetical protein